MLTWDGERCLPWIDDYQVVYEHYHRYAFASRWASGDVLDLASGEGYGAQMLTGTGANVTGVDIDLTAVRHASQRYPHVRFVHGSVLGLEALELGQFDLVTCFEAIEHVVEQEDLLRGIRSALRPGGVAIISTPDKDLDQGDRANPHHVRELSRPEFLNLLREHFESVYLFGQRLAVGSAIWPLDRTMEGTSFERLDSSEDSWSVLSREPEASYLIAVCSDGAEPPPAEASVALDHDITAIRAPQRRLIEAEAELRWLQLPIRSRAIFRTRARLGVIRRRVFRRAR